MNDWYKDAIIYEAHVRAFCDNNDDGIGDFQGLTSKLEYLQGLTDYRNFEYTDMALNSAGVGLGLLLAQTPLDRGLAWFESAFARV